MQIRNYKIAGIKKISTSVILLLLFHYSFAQPTQAEINKMIKQAQEQMKKYSKDSSANRIMKNLIGQQKNISDAIKNQPQNNNTASNNSYAADLSEYGNVDNWKFPAKNITMISSLPKKILTRAELIYFLNEVYARLSKKMLPRINSSAQSLAAKYNNDGNKMGDAAVIGWYTNYREESLLLIIKAAAINPDNGVLLNNCAALLNMSGIEQAAIPVLKYIIQSYPGNAMVLNNLGQAYAGLGETDTAMYYIKRCLKTDPENSEANNTAGQIEAAKGSIDNAIAFFQQSLKGAYNKTAELKLKKIKKDSKIGPFIKPRVKIPEYFNRSKYQFPMQCTNVENAAEAEAENKAFREALQIQSENYLHKLSALAMKWAQLQQGVPTARKTIKGEFMAQPFSEMCSTIAGEMLTDYSKELGDMGPQGRTGKNYIAKMQSLENEYQNKYTIIKKGFDEREKEGVKKGCCGEGNISCCISSEEKCKAYNGLANEYLPQFAANMEDWQVKYQLVFKKYFDDLVYWSYLAFHNIPLSIDLASNPPHTDEYYQLNSFYPLVISYLKMLESMAVTKIIKPCNFELVTATKDTLAIQETECVVNLTIPFGFGKAQLNCDKFSISGGEGAVFAYERNFKTHQSTVSVGIGLTLELGVKVGSIKGGVSAGISETAFITFDGNNGIADAGLKNEAKASAGATGVGKDEVSIGSILGINSGWNFNEGPFKGMFGPAPDVQVNKNVKMF